VRQGEMNGFVSGFPFYDVDRAEAAQGINDGADQVGRGQGDPQSRLPRSGVYLAVGWSSGGGGRLALCMRLRAGVSVTSGDRRGGVPGPGAAAFLYGR
jgi:hypothetical protein